ncbi:uncharacterized protein BT62DRAFT_1029404 [Guyanagaster necrorhizus]|uniref:Protein kinase domain-containing protein n=1 Tax=Guyanagaster necrorhizus TaxID=856835 RepID=A0A9P8AS04_9AGAR|nr:uncharacterized protein BT62DRAFT_1029404 [Guyanagaster necrorhizus MCA 3950]KAG7444382.1 hypothetical protein BT62DRAFT_1029404 [Guyanagaster necrorhizus MCA 3950]
MTRTYVDKGRLYLKECLGGGAFGSLFHALDLKTIACPKHMCAIKCIQADGNYGCSNRIRSTPQSLPAL